MNLTLKRVLQTDVATFGILSTDSYPLCVTLELPWLNNETGASCIPPGTYHCIPHNSPDHPNTWEVIGVPNRSEILIHIGNFPKDTEGCILVGQSFSGMTSAIYNSGGTMDLLRNVLPKEFDLTVTNDPKAAT